MNGTPPPDDHVSGRVEHDDVATGIGRPARRQLVDQDVLVGHQRRLHRALLDLVGLRDEGLDAEEDEDREDEGLDDLEEAAEGRALGHVGGRWLTGAGV